MPGFSNALQYVFDEAGWAGGYRLSHCQRVTGLIPLIANVAALSPPPSETLLLAHSFVQTLV